MIKKDFDPSKIDDKWNETELIVNWLSKILDPYWSGFTTPQIGFRYRQEAKSSGRDRLDIALWHDKHVVGCIEAKRPKCHLTSKEGAVKEIFLKQAIRYTSTRCQYHHGKIVSPIGILVNGHEAIIFDGSLALDDVKNFYDYFDFQKDGQLDLFLKIFNTDNWDNKTGVSEYPYAKIKCQETKKAKIKSCDDHLAKDIFDLYTEIYKNIEDKKAAFSTTITLYILALLRDCGLYPNDVIKELENRRSTESWSAILDGISEILQTDFSNLKQYYCEQIWDFYKKTSWFNGNLATFPPTGLGKAYENLLSKLANNGTSYYTPPDLIAEILTEIKPNSKTKILDPTCGSASFLSAITEYITNNEDITSKEDIRNYIETKIYGVDKDWFACQIAKSVLVSIYANKIPYSEEERNRFKAPKINIIEADFFSWETNNKFDLILGNPPWGNIDQHVNPEIYEQLKSYKSYEKFSDVGCAVVERSLKHLKENGKFSFVCKHEVLDGHNQTNHRENIWKNNGVYVWDYGRYHWFNNSSCSIVIYGQKGSEYKEYSVISKHISAKKEIEKYDGMKLGEIFKCHEGNISGRDKLYRHLGNKFKAHKQSKLEIEDRCITPFKIHADNRTFFLMRNEKIPLDIREYCENTEVEIQYKKSKILGIPKPTIIVDTILNHIHNRSGCVQSKQCYDGWARVFSNPEEYIVLPTFIRDGRIRAAYANKEMVPTSTTLYLYMNQINKIDLFYSLAFLNTAFAFDVMLNHPEIRQCQAKATIAVKPTTLENVLVPNCSSEVKGVIAKITETISLKEITQIYVEDFLSIIDRIFPIIAYTNDEIEMRKIKSTLKQFERKLEQHLTKEAV